MDHPEAQGSRHANRNTKTALPVSNAVRFQELATAATRRFECSHLEQLKMTSPFHLGKVSFYVIGNAMNERNGPDRRQTTNEHPTDVRDSRALPEPYIRSDPFRAPHSQAVRGERQWLVARAHGLVDFVEGQQLRGAIGVAHEVV